MKYLSNRGTIEKITRPDGTFDSRRFDVDGKPLSREWVSADGTYRTQSFNPDGTSNRHTVEANGTTRDTKFDSKGNILNQTERFADGRTIDRANYSDGTYRIKETGPDGKLISREWSSTDGNRRIQCGGNKEYF